MAFLTTTLARILFSLPFLINGFFHIMGAQMMADGMVASWVPMKVPLVIFTGIVIFAGGVAIIIKKQAKNACLVLAAFLIVTGLAVHLPAMMNGTSGAGMGFGDLIKDLSIAGGALALAGMFAKEESN